MTQRLTCGGCNSVELLPVLDLGETPVANTLPKLDEAVTRYPLRLGVCSSCELVQQLEIVPDDVLYGVDYGFYASASLPKVAYHRELARRLFLEHRDQAQRLTVEIGCNDGDLLRHFRDVGCKVLGVDPSRGPALQAAESGIDVRIAPFTREMALSIVDSHGHAGLIIANHVAAHVLNLEDFFGGIGELVADDGVVVIEVQYLADMLTGNQLDHVYHEHRYHYSISSLIRVAGQYGDLRVIDVRHTPAQSGSINVSFVRSARLKTAKHSWRFPAASVYNMLNAEHWLCDVASYSSLQGRADRIRVLLQELIAEELQAGRLVAGYGAPAKATTLLNYCNIDASMVPYVVDTTPHKAGRVIPGTDIRIVSREWDSTAQALYHSTVPWHERKPDTWLLLAHNYLGDILRREWEFTAGGGRWIVPIPVPVML